MLAGAAAHWVIHPIGVVVQWRVGAVEFPYDTAVLGGSVDLGARLSEVVWFACGWLRHRRSGHRAWLVMALPNTATLAAFSLGLCVLGLPETVAGIVVNPGILSGEAWVARAGARPPETEVL